MNFEKAKKFRQLIAQKYLVTGVAARDVLDAKIVENAGFDFVWSSSLGVSASFCIPDASLISMSQYIDAARHMGEIIDIPIIIDADTGYGNANNVIYAVKLFEHAGIAATAAGFTGLLGYIGATVSGICIGWAAHNYGWHIGFSLIIASGVFSGLFFALTWKIKPQFF